MKSLLLGSLLSAVALFMWGFVYFGISGIPYNFLGEANDNGLVLDAEFPESGTYVVPDPRLENVEDLHLRGPFAMVHIRKGGMPMMSPSLMIGGFVHGFGYALLLGLLLKQICRKSGYGARVGFVTLAGLAGTFMARIGDVIWWHNAWDWQLSTMAYTVIGSSIVGAILAKFIKNDAQAQSQ